MRRTGYNSRIMSSISFFQAELLRWLLPQFKPGLKLARSVRIGRWVVLQLKHGARQGTISLASGCDLQDGVRLETWGGTIEVKENTFLGPYTVIYGHGDVHIGKNCLIAMHSRIVSSSHTIPPIGVAIRSMPDQLHRTIIADDVWLGAGSTILAGVTLHEGCIIGAGAVVTRDIPAHAIAVGVPARVIGYRPNATAAQTDTGS